jgi:hypothetical protein
MLNAIVMAVISLNAAGNQQEGGGPTWSGPLKPMTNAVIGFKSGHPADSESLTDSMDGPPHFREQLSFAIHLMEKEPRTMRVVGSADGTECVPSACDNLAMRRATLLYDYLIQHGISKTKLESPSVIHERINVANDATDRGHAANLRANRYARVWWVEPFP